MEGAVNGDVGQWLEAVTERFIGGGDLHPHQPLLVAPLTEIVRSGGPASTQEEALGLLHYLAALADDPTLCPPTGRVGPGPRGDREIQERIRAEIARALPILQEVFDGCGTRREVAATLAAIAARAGAGRLYSTDEALRAEFASTGSAQVSHALAVVVARTVAAAPSWTSWFQAVLRHVAAKPEATDSDAVLGLVAWCMLVQGGIEIDRMVSDRIGELTAAANVDTPMLWRLFDPVTALKAKSFFVKHCPSSFVLRTVCEMLAASFDPFLQIISETCHQDTLHFQLSARPPRLDLAALTNDQREMLDAIVAAPAAWRWRTNLWDLWGLPDSREGLETMLIGCR